MNDAEEYMTETEYLEWAGNKVKELTRQNALMLEALKAVEWVNDEQGDPQCPWCGQYKSIFAARHHAEDCPRQAAIAAAEKEVK